MRRRILRQTTAAVVMGLGVAWATAGAAQSISDEERDRSVEQNTEQEMSDRIAKQSERLDKEEGGETQDRGPGMTQDDVEAQKMTAEEIDRLKRRLEKKNEEMISKLDRLIEDNPYSDSKPQWMFQKAELTWELRNMQYLRQRSQYNQCMQAARQGTTDKSECEEPEPDYSEAQTIYKKILTQYPDYERIDEVIYRLGTGLIEAGKGSQAVSYLQRLVENYPNSKYIAEANLELAEYFFKQEMLGPSADKYKTVLEYPDNPNYDYARYKLGWVYYNQSKYREAVDTFKTVVENSNEKLGFRENALDDLVQVWSEIDDGWKEARSYFIEQKDKEFAFEQLGKMASIYSGQGKSLSAIAVYEYFIDERANHQKIPTWMENVIKEKKKIGNFEDLEKTINEYVAYLSPGGTWWKKNSDNEDAHEKATRLTKASVSYLANQYHQKAQDKGETKLYRSAAKYYRKYLKMYPEDKAAFDMNFFLAEIELLDLEQYGRAAEHYQKVVDLYENGNYPKDVEKKEVMSVVKDSAYGVVNAYDELVKKNHDDSILVKMAEYEERNEDGTYQEAQKTERGPPSEKDPNERQELLKYEKGFVKASDQYSEMFPETDITPTVDFVAAEVYKARGHYKECIDRYESIIEHAPDHRYASFAGNSLLEANYVLERWDEVEKWARHLLDNEIFDVTPKEDLKSAIAYAINERAKELEEADKTKKAANELLRLADEFPDSPLAPGAIFNAAAIYESGDELKKAVEQYERVVSKYPSDKKAPDSLFVLGLIAESRANFEQAASYFSRLGNKEKTYTVTKEGSDGGEPEDVDKKYSEHPKAADAVFNAAELRKAMEQWGKAISTYEKYIEMFPDRDDIRDVKLELAYLEKNREKPEKALERFQSFADRDDLKPEEKVEISAQIGLLIEETEPDEWKEKSDERFTEAVETWQELSDDKKKATRFHASHARFRQAERLYKEFEEVELEFPQSKLKDLLEEKAEKLSKAEEVYFEINSMKSPKWASAAVYRIGKMYSDYYQEIRDLPLPDGLDARQKQQYRFFLDERAAPLQEKAVKAFNRAWKVALELKAYNEWSRKSAERISELQSQSFPITGQPGVDTGHGRVKFYTPTPLTDFDAAVERMKKRIPEEPPEPEKPEEGEAAEGEGEATEGEGDAPDAEGEESEESDGESTPASEGGKS